jgi:hypothetical protein
MVKQLGWLMSTNGRAGIHREIRYEITVRDLIAAIRTYGAELSGERHNL